MIFPPFGIVNEKASDLFYQAHTEVRPQNINELKE